MPTLLQLITPTNLLEQKEKFFASQSYHPVFNYIWQTNKPQINLASNKEKLINAIINQDIALITYYARLYFEVEDWRYLEVAKQLTSSMPVLEETGHNYNFIATFTKATRFLDLYGYSVKVVDTPGFNFRPSFKNKIIFMSKHANFQFFDIEGEICHELVHIIRYENGKYNKIRKSANYLPTEEGLATLMHDTGKNGYASRFQHAAEYIASRIGMEGSLRDIYEYFLSIGFNNDLAWERAVRHKFGFIKTREGGDILKPAMYFAHSQVIQKLSSAELLRLFVGKISLSDLIYHKEYRGSIEKDKLIQFYGLD